MKIPFSSIILLLCPLSHGASISPTHPIIGVWQVEVPGTSCTETYTFRENGTKTATSAKEIADSLFLISASPSQAGYYELTDTVVKTNGQPDCQGHATPIGDTVTVFVRFGDPANTFSFCLNQSGNKCIGPFKKSTGGPP